VASPISHAGYPMGGGEGGLILIASDGAAFEVSIEPGDDEIKLFPIGGVPEEKGTGVVSAIPFPKQEDRPPSFMVAREGWLDAAVLRGLGEDPKRGEKPVASGVLRHVPGERIMPESAADDVFAAGKTSFIMPHAMALLPLKGYGGRDLFAAYSIMSGSKRIGEMGFFYWNANDRPAGSLSDIRFDGRRGSAKLSFSDPTGDPLSYRATVRAAHGGSLDDWIDGFEGGRLSFSVKGDPSGVGLWPVEIMVWASDPGGLSAGSRVLMRRDGTLEAISEVAPSPL